MYRVKILLNDLVEYAYPHSPKQKAYKAFYVEYIDKEFKSKHGDYNTKNKHIRIFNLSRTEDHSILRNGDFGISGDIVRFPHVYEVRSGSIFNTIDFDVETFRKMLGTTIVRIKNYTVLPSIFKFMREWAKCGGRKNP